MLKHKYVSLLGKVGGASIAGSTVRRPTSLPMEKGRELWEWKMPFMWEVSTLLFGNSRRSEEGDLDGKSARISVLTTFLDGFFFQELPVLRGVLRVATIGYL